MGRVGGGEFHVQVVGIEAGVVEPGDAGVVVRLDLGCRALQRRGLVQQVSVDRLRQAFGHRLVLLLDAGVLGCEECRDALRAEEDERNDADHQEADADVPAKAVHGGPTGVGRGCGAHIEVTGR